MASSASSRLTGRRRFVESTSLTRPRSFSSAVEMATFISDLPAATGRILSTT